MKPILFNTNMVRAILEGRKTVTRRDPFQMPPDYSILKGLYRDGKRRLCAIFQADGDPTTEAVYARYDIGDILWVRETFVKLPETPGGHFRPNGVFYYKADQDKRPDKFRKNGWHPSIHMPREAARIFLRVTGVRVERLDDMNTDDVFMEGVFPTSTFEHIRDRWHQVWNSTIKPKDRTTYGWEANPWVWVIDFQRISNEEAEGK